MNIRPFIHDVSFDDQAMRAMGVAFDQACDVLKALGIDEASATQLAAQAKVSCSRAPG